MFFFSFFVCLESNMPKWHNLKLEAKNFTQFK